VRSFLYIFGWLFLFMGVKYRMSEAKVGDSTEQVTKDSELDKMVTNNIRTKPTSGRVVHSEISAEQAYTQNGLNFPKGAYPGGRRRTRRPRNTRRPRKTRRQTKKRRVHKKK
jgi:hypothetical protein